MKLVLEIKYGGLGDHLFYSAIPKIAKEKNAIEKIYISNHSDFRSLEIKKLIWELNPYVDGFVDEKGVDISDFTEISEDENILGALVRKHNLVNDTYFIEPEVYYKPVYKQKYDYTIFDPNFVSYVGSVSNVGLNLHLLMNGVKIDKKLKALNSNAKKIWFTNEEISCDSIFDYCDLIHSSKKFFCLTSGGATLSAALKKPATAFYGKGQKKMFHHSNQMKYIKVT